MNLQQHPLSAAFPAMPEAELEALAMDIEQNGQRDPGVVLDSLVLDGWHRFLACEKAGVEFRFVEFDESDPVAFVLSRNLHRRHLTESQRAGAVVKCHEWKRGGARVQGGVSTAEMAAEADVSPRTIVHAKRAEEIGLGDEVRAGKVSARTAAGIAKKPKKQRERAIKAIKDGDAPRAEKKRKVDDAKLRAELIDLQGKYADLLEQKNDIADTARELEDKLTMYETTEPDEQQKLIADIQKKLQRKDAEIQRQRGQISDLNNKCNALIRQVKSLQKKAA